MNKWVSTPDTIFFLTESLKLINFREHEFINLNIEKMGKFEVTTRKNGEFQFNLKARNGQTVLASEGYSSRSNCMNGIDSVKRNSQEDGRFDRKNSSNGKWYFNLKASNGQIIGTSEMYESSSGMEKGIESVKANAPSAEVDDQTS